MGLARLALPAGPRPRGGVLTRPLVYEINTRAWLHELGVRQGSGVTLDGVMNAELDEWRCHGFSHIWLMGVWTTGPRSRVQALSDPGLAAAYDESLPHWRQPDVLASPYAIARYEVSPLYGGDEALQRFRARLHARGLRLIVDFVPNHVGLDHPWLSQRPELLVTAPQQFPGSFAQGSGWMAHGKDPYFAPWTDTAQVEWRREETHEAMIEELRRIATLADGVRCDMAMLVLPDVFTKTWAHVPMPSPVPDDFWGDAIRTVKGQHPAFLFIAEAYWGLEPRLLSLGFDYTYDKRLCELLVHERGSVDVSAHLLGLGPEQVGRSVHFLENHDEPRVASRLPVEAHRAAALLALGLPGMTLLHQGQLEGARVFARIQLRRRAGELHDPAVQHLYADLLERLPQTAVGRGVGTVLQPRATSPHDGSFRRIAAVHWQDEGPAFDLVVVNTASERSQCFLPLPEVVARLRRWHLTDLLGSEVYEREGPALVEPGLYLDVAPHAAQLFRFVK